MRVEKTDMLKPILAVVAIVSLAACAHRGAVRVECDGVLRPVNTPIGAHEPPVSTVPVSPAKDSAPEARP
jgi:hypothetical protein